VHETALELSRRIEQLKQDRAKERTRLKEPRLYEGVEQSLRRHVEWLGVEIDNLENEWLELIQKDAELAESYRLVLTVPNVGPKTARVMVSELPPKSQIVLRRKAVGLAGLAPKKRRSGTSLNAPDQIPRACNPHLKKATYMPAVQALRRSAELRDFYMRLVAGGKHPKQALAAVMRKIFSRILAVLCRGTEWKPDLTT
jgi:transposase